MTFGADRVKIYGPKVTDGSYTITFETGEYSQHDVAELMRLPINHNLKVIVEVIDDELGAQ